MTLGLPSRSPPIHVPKRIGDDLERQAARRCAASARDPARAGSAAAPATASARTPAGRRGPRRAASAGRARISSVSQQAAISRRSVSTTVSRSQSVRSGGPSRPARAAMRSYFCSSVRRTISVGMRGQHQLDLRASRPRRAGRPASGRRRSAGRTSPRTSRAAAAGRAPAGRRGGGGCGGAARRCWRGSGTARRRARPAATSSTGMPPSSVASASKSLRVAGAAALGEGADALHQRERSLPFPRADRLPEQLAEQPDIVAQGLVGIGGSGHGGSVS